MAVLVNQLNLAECRGRYGRLPRGDGLRRVRASQKPLLVRGEQPCLHLQVHEVVVETRRTAHRLARVVHDEVEMRQRLEEVRAERLDARCVAQVDAVDPQPVAPRLEVRLGGVAFRGVGGEARQDDDLAPGAEQQNRRLEPDLHPGARHDGDAPPQVPFLCALHVVEVATGHAHLVVEVMDRGEVRPAHVADPRLVHVPNRFLAHAVVEGLATGGLEDGALA